MGTSSKYDSRRPEGERPREPDEAPSEPGRITLGSVVESVAPSRRRVIVWVLRASFGVFALLVAYLYQQRSAMPCVLTAVGVAVIAVALEVWLRRGRQKRRDVLRCGKCGQDLSKMPAAGECPGCGVRYEIVTDSVEDDG